MNAAGWCRNSLMSATLFEKLAVQTSLGVGILHRMGTTTTTSFTSTPTVAGRDINDTPPHPQPAERSAGVVPLYPAETCIPVSEVEPEQGLMRLGYQLPQRPTEVGMDEAKRAFSRHPHLCNDGIEGEVTPLGSECESEAGGRLVSASCPLAPLRPGDLCDFRAVGAMAVMQAERDAYTWFHASRLSARLLSSVGDIGEHDNHDDNPLSSLSPPPPSSSAATSLSSSVARGGIEGCFAAGAALRFVFAPMVAESLTAWRG